MVVNKDLPLSFAGMSRKHHIIFHRVTFSASCRSCHVHDTMLIPIRS